MAQLVPTSGVVMVRGASAFLSAAAIVHREQHCVAVAERAGVTVSVVADLPDVAAGAPPLLVTWSVPGLARDAGELRRLLDAMAAGTVVAEARSGELVVVPAEAAHTAARAGYALARAERSEHAARTREGRMAVARSGRWLGGRHPLGWIVAADGTAELDERAAGFVRSGTLRIAAGSSVGAVVAQWNQAGFRTSTGRDWTFGSARRVLLRARNAGLVEYRGEIVGRSSWPAIVTVAQWRQARAAMLRTRPARESA